MMRATVLFFVLGVIAAFFAYGDVEGKVAVIAQTVFFICVGLFVISIFVMPVRKH